MSPAGSNGTRSRNVERIWSWVRIPRVWRPRSGYSGSNLLQTVTGQLGEMKGSVIEIEHRTNKLDHAWAVRLNTVTLPLELWTFTSIIYHNMLNHFTLSLSRIYSVTVLQSYGGRWGGEWLARVHVQVRIMICEFRMKWEGLDLYYDPVQTRTS